jgi:DNA polymerase-3 subunit delta
MATVEALQWLARRPEGPLPPVCVAFGEEPFLRQQVVRAMRQAALGEDQDTMALRVLPAEPVGWADVAEELYTPSLFAPRKAVVLEEADAFVAHHRAALERYVEQPAASAVLILDVRQWPKTTRLYKALERHGLQVACIAPKPAQLPAWIGSWAKARYRVAVDADAARLLADMVGCELGLLDQELAKLATSAGKGPITAPLVQQLVGGWRAKTTWDMLDAAAEGNTPEALLQLDRLLAAGEQPLALLAAMAHSLRRLALAARLVLRAETARRRLPLRDALQQAGLPPFVLAKAETQLRQLGRSRAARLYRWLLDADLDLKGRSQLPPRLVLEQLLVRLGREYASQAREAVRADAAAPSGRG